MSPDDLKAIRKSLGLTLAELGQAVGRSEITMLRYEHGQWPIPADVRAELRRLQARAKRAAALEARAAALRKVT